MFLAARWGGSRVFSGGWQLLNEKQPQRIVLTPLQCFRWMPFQLSLVAEFPSPLIFFFPLVHISPPVAPRSFVRQLPSPKAIGTLVVRDILEDRSGHAHKLCGVTSSQCTK